MKKLLLSLLIIPIVLSLNIGLVHAAGCSEECAVDEECTYVGDKWMCVKTLRSATFDVTKILKLQGEDEQESSYFSPDRENSPIVEVIIMVINFATGIAGTLAMILFIVAGIRFMIAQGNQQTIDEAKDTFKYAIIGLLVAFMSYTIAVFVQSIFL